MIKKLLSIALVVVAVSANAQQFRIGQAQASNVKLGARGTTPTTYSVTVDTLRPASVMPGGCAVGTNTVINGLWNYVNDVVAPMDSGYIFGTGIISLGAGGTTSCMATELGQKYNVTGAATVTDILVWAGHATGTTATVKAKVYTEIAASHKPGVAIGSASSNVAMSAFQVGGYTTFNFPTPPAVSAGNFFATISVPATFGGTDHDTLSVLSTQIGGCPPAGSDSCSAIKLSAPVNAWYLVKVGFGANCDLMIFPVINMGTGINAVSKNGVSIFAASPNPANNSVNINFSLENPSKVDIDIIDVTGKIVKTIKGTETFTANAKHSIAVDVTTLESGSYFYSINSNGTKMFSKFVVTK